MLVTVTGQSIPGQYAVWRDDPASLGEVASWGGMFQMVGAFVLSDDEQLSLQLEDGRRGEILLKETNIPGGACLFVGQGIYPLAR